jgi:hypothetical protein
MQHGWRQARPLAGNNKRALPREERQSRRLHQLAAHARHIAIRNLGELAAALAGDPVKLEDRPERHCRDAREPVGNLLAVPAGQGRDEVPRVHQEDLLCRVDFVRVDGSLLNALHDGVKRVLLVLLQRTRDDGGQGGEVVGCVCWGRYGRD